MYERNCRETTKWLSDHNSSLNWANIVENHPQNVTFHSLRRPNSYCIGNQPLYVQKITLRKVIKDQDGIPRSQSDFPTTKTAQIGQKTSKIIPKMSRSALSGDLTGVTLATNHSIFNKRP